MASSVTFADAHADSQGQDFPEDWTPALFDDVVVEATSGDWGTDHGSDDRVGARIIRGTDFSLASRGRLDGVPIRYLKQSSVDRRRLAPGDLLVELSGGSKGQPTGRILLTSKSLLNNELPIVFSNFVRRLRLDEDRVNSAFAMYYWSNLYRRGKTRPYEKRTTGIRNFRLTDFLKNELILIPPIPEQQAIVNILDAVQRTREETVRVIGATRDLKRSLARHLFVYGLAPVSSVENVELQETEIGPIPKHWQLVRLRDVLAEPLRNGYSARAASSGSGVRTLTLSAVTKDDFSIANTKVTEAKPDRVRDLWLRQDDILIERANTRVLVGTAALYEGPDDFAIYPDLVIRARVQQAVINTKFAVEFLRTPVVRAYFRRNARGAAGNMPKIGHSIIEELRLPLPPIDEQTAIAQVLRAVDGKNDSEAAQLAALDQFFSTLVDELTTGRERVKHLEPAHG